MMKTGANLRARLMVSIFGVGLGFSAVLAGEAQTPPAEPVQEEAQTVDDRNNVERVVVTATRRSASLLEVPVAVSAHSGEQLTDQGIVSLQDLTKVDPTFSTQSYGAAFSQNVIRGVSSDVGATVGVYLNEAPLLGGTFSQELGGDGKPGIRLHDIDRVEILRGPQGTLFGSSSMSGTLRVITAMPDFDEFQAAAAGTVIGVRGGNALYMTDGMINVPVSDRFAVRAVGWWEKGGGFIDQVATGFSNRNINDQEVVGGRLLVSARPTNRLTVTAMALQQEIDVDGVQDWRLDAGPYINRAESSEFYNDKVNLYSIEANYDLDFGTILATASRTEQELIRPSDSTPTANFFGVPGISSFIMMQDFEATTGEVRFTSSFEGPFQLVAGAYYEETHTDGDVSVVIGDPSTGRTPCLSYAECHANGFVPNVVFSRAGMLDVEQFAFYAQGDYEIVDGLTATLGVRYYEADLVDAGIIQQDVFAEDPVCATHYVYRGFGPPNLCGFAFGDVTVPYSRGAGQATEDYTSYNASLLWEPSDTLSFFARAASGFRIGGVNGSAILAQSAGVTVPEYYEPDSLWSYEAGVRKYFWNRRGYVDAAVYHIDWSEQQVTSADPSAAFDFVANAGTTEINGVELQGQLMPVDGLTISGGLVWTDAQLSEDLPATSSAIGFSGDTLPGFAEWSSSLRVSYEWSVSSAFDAYTDVGATYRSSMSTAFNPIDPNYNELDAYTLVDASIGLRNEVWDFRVFAQNLTDEAAQLAMHVSPDGLRVYSPRPFSVGARVAARF